MSAGRILRQRIAIISGLLLLCAGATLLYWRQPTAPPDTPVAAPTTDELAGACREMSVWLARRLGPECSVLVREPFVLGGDLSVQQLEAWQRRVLQPSAAALARDFFRQRPTEPICVALAATPASYRRYANQLGVPGGESLSSQGFYQPHLRLIIVAANGEAALRHELTHALMDFDFPNAPPWLREGLAALYEEIAWEGTPARMRGQPGPRLHTLQAALSEERGETLETLFENPNFQGPDEALHYATARYFCLYLQQRGVLPNAYAAVRDDATADPTGSRTVRRILSGVNETQLNAEFRAYVLQLAPPKPAGRR